MRGYSTREVADIAGLNEAQIRRWVRLGLVDPTKDERGCWRYSFQDLALLRTAARLLQSQVTPNRVTRALRLIRAQLPAGRPLSAVRIFVTGQRVVVRDRLASWEPESGQGSFDFDVQSVSQDLSSPVQQRWRTLAERRQSSAVELYQSALDLELEGRGEEARGAYEAALKRDPQLVAARINLGRLLHAANRVTEAEALYRAALEQDPGNHVAAFNLGVALEDQGAVDAAIAAYRRAVEIDANYADAHFNLSRLLEASGDDQGALRHLSAFRRLMRRDS